MTLEDWGPLPGSDEDREHWHAALNPWRMYEQKRAWAEWNNSAKQVRARALAVIRCPKRCELAVLWEAASGRAVWIRFNRERRQHSAGAWHKDQGVRRGAGREVLGAVEMLESYAGDEQVPHAAFEMECWHIGKQEGLLRKLSPGLLNLARRPRARQGIVDRDGLLTWRTR